METHVATCRCGQLSATCTGEPVRVSVCHCLHCQKRSGSAFAAQARWPIYDVTLTGEARQWTQSGDSGSSTTFHFCGTCGSCVAFISEGMANLIAIPVGAFADVEFPAPTVSVWEERKHRWVEIDGDGIQHLE